MSAVGDILRRSTRLTKGVKPSRYRDQEETQPVGLTTKMASVPQSKSAKSVCSVRRKEVELEAEKELLDINSKVTSKEVELQHAQNSVKSLDKRLQLLKTCTYLYNEEDRVTEMANLRSRQLDADDKVGDLTVELEALKRLAQCQISIVDKRKNLELEKLESDEEDISEHEQETAARVSYWVDQQNSMKHATPPHRNVINATFCEVRKPTVTETRIAQNPTVSYDASSDESSVSQNYKPPGNANEVTMRDLVDALQSFGGRQSRQIPLATSIDRDLPRFGGDPAQWVQFKAEYDRTSKKFNFDASENMMRIRKALVGPAKQTVEHLMANVNNVITIMECLEKRFGRPRLVLNSLATKAKSCGNVSTAKPESIIEFGIAVQALVANIVSFREEGYLNSVELLDLLVKKLSPHLATKWFEWLSADRNRPENLQGFCDWTSTQLDIAYQRVDFKYVESTEEKSERRRPRGSGAINATSSDNDICVCCHKGKHLLEKCFLFKKKNLDERWQIVKSSKVCISCLKVGHKSKECSSATECEMTGCTRFHHKLLHNSKEAPKAEVVKIPSQNVEVIEENVNVEGNIAFITGCDGPLPIVPVKLRGPDGTVKCHALLDTGASRSLITKGLAEKIGLKGEQQKYSYTGAAGGKITEHGAEKVECEISGILRGSKYGKLRSAMTVQQIKMNPYSIDMDEVKKKWPHLSAVAAKNLNGIVPELIVGNNNPHLILSQKVITGKDDEPVGWRCALGWTVSGTFDSDKLGGSVNVIGGDISNQHLHDIIKRSFTLEDFGVKVTTAKGNNPDERRAFEILQRTTRKVNGVWETGLLWKKDRTTLPDNYFTALNRLESTEKRMKDPIFKKLYFDKIGEYLSKGYIRKLTEEESKVRGTRTCFIPHFGHTNPNKPGKFRFILDAKVKTKGVSLNDELLKGPDLIRSLVGVLWNFRRHRIALTGDITDMFHRVKIREEDRDSQRLLWRDGDSTRKPDHYQMVVLMFGSTCSPSSAIFVKNKNAADFSEVYPKAAEVTVSDFFVDDCLTGGETKDEVIELRKQISEINSAGNFTVCKWLSNNAEVVASIPSDLRAQGAKCLEEKDLIGGEKVLGMWWDPMEDVFQFRLGLHKVEQKILDGCRPTKREMCGLVMSLYDPLGFISHFKVKGLMLLQEVWRAGIGWDDEIPTVTHTKWLTWLLKLPEVGHVKIPRCYLQLPGVPDEVMLNVFVDASFEGYSSICYLRMKHGSEVTVSFLCGKARVAPLKKTTIPRLELQAALMGARLASTLGKELKMDFTSRRFWSDSKTVLCWLRSRAGKFKEFVANRVGEIQEDTDVFEWHWIPTKQNIADVATRFEGDLSFDPDSEWFGGPKFLYQDCDDWKFEAPAEPDKIAEKEGTIATVVTRKESTQLQDLIQVTPNPERFSSYFRLVRATAAVKAAGNYWLKRSRKEEVTRLWKTVKASETGLEKSKFYSCLSPEYLVEAEKQLCLLAQLQEYEDEHNILESGTGGKKGKLWKLCPFIGQDGLLRLNGRIGVADVGIDTKFPIILPSRCRITELLVDEEHRKNAHQGVETVLCNLRRKFWIVDGKHAVKRSWTRCQFCVLRRCKPAQPKMGNLPMARLASRQPPFSHCGVDLFGPFLVTVGRRHEKRWGVLICCMTTRAINLDVVHDLSTDEIIMALSRFIDVRGRPQFIHSDNGTNFVGAAKELRTQMSGVDFDRIRECGRFQDITWRFNPPAAPHMGGAWERLIQSVKKCLTVVLHEKNPKDTTLLTVFKSVENLMNSRPLTSVSTDPTDPDPITPNHLLRGDNDAGPSIPVVLDTSEEFLRTQWKRSQVLADQYWSRWTLYYLPKLIRLSKWHEKTNPLEIGDLVYLVDDHLPRNCWSLGYITAVFPGADGQVRTVEVTTNCKTSKKKITYRRPAIKVCPLGLKREIGNAADPQFGGQNVAM